MTVHIAEAKLRPVRLWDPREDAIPLWALELMSPSPGPGATGTALSDFLENEILDHVLSAATFTAAATLYVALFTAAPSDAGGGTEVTGGSYAREAVTNNATNFPAAVGGSKSNGTDFDFGIATANWGTITHVALIDAAAAGNYYFWGALTASKTVNTNDGFKFLATKLTFALD